MQLQQGLAVSEMGFTVQVAQQQFWAADVSHGSWPCENSCSHHACRISQGNSPSRRL